MSIEGLRVAHVFAGVEGGSWVFDQLRALQDQYGCKVFAVLAGAEGSLPDKCRAAGIEIKSFDFGTLNAWSVPWRMLSLALWFRKQRIDVVQSHVMNSTMFARPAAWLADVPVRLTMVTGPYYMQSPGFRRTELRTCLMETGIIPSCELTGELYRQTGVPEELICKTLYYGPRETLWNPAQARSLGLHARYRLPDKAPLIGVVAMMYERIPDYGDYCPPGLQGRMVKGHEELVAAMPMVLEEFPEARMLFIGKGWGPNGPQCEEEVRQMIAAAGLGEKIVMTGFVEDVPGAYLDLDVSVQASLNENLGGTVESLLMARPTVATRVGGMVDAVVDGETGVLVEPGDPADLARGIRDLLRDPERGRQLGLAGRRRMLARFTLEATMPELAALYGRQFGAARGSRRLSRLLLNLAIAPVQFLPAVLGGLWPLMRNVARVAFYRSLSLVPRPLRRGLRRLIETGRRLRRAN